MVIVGAAAAARADGAAVLAAAASIALAAGQGKDAGWNAFNVLHTAASRVAGLDLGLRAGRGRARCRRACWRRPAQGALDVVYLLGADEIDMHALGKAFVDLPGQPRRCRRAARRRHPAGRRLHREERHLRQHRGPRADDEPRRVPAGRRQGGLGDRARALRARSATSCPTTAFPPCAPPCTRRRRRWRALDAVAPADLDGVEALAARGGALGAEPFGAAGARLLSHQSDRARLRRDGRAQRAARRACSRGRPERMASTWSWPEIWQAYLWPLLVMAFQSVVLLVALLVIVAFLLLMDRKVWAAVQLRRGPNVVGPFGLLQSFADLLKFVLKEPLIPAGADKGVFLLAPLVASVLALAAWAVIPLEREQLGPLGDLRPQRRRALSVRHLLARRLRHHHGRLGLELEVPLPRLAALGGADGVLRGLDRLRHHHRAAVRRLAQPDRHRQRAEGRARHALRACRTRCSTGTG